MYLYSLDSGGGSGGGYKNCLASPLNNIYMHMVMCPWESRDKMKRQETVEMDVAEDFAVVILVVDYWCFI